MKKKYFLFLLFLLKTYFIIAQTPYILQDSNYQTYTNFEILADQNYTFEQIQADKTLAFTKNPAFLKEDIRKKYQYYWLRLVIQNNLEYSKKIYLRPLPMFDNTIYFYDKEQKKWQHTKTGIGIPDLQRSQGIKPVLVASQSIDTFFVKVQIAPLIHQYKPSKFEVKIYKESYYNKNEDNKSFLWGATCLAMSLFFLYNLYIYFIFKDRTYLYYLIIVVGGIIYVTAFYGYFNVLSSFRFYNLNVRENCDICYFDLNSVFSQVSILLVLFGFVKFTSLYLRLSTYLPFWNKLLNYTLYSFISIISIITFLTIAKIKYLYTSPIIILDNIATAIIILVLILVGIFSLRKGYKPARYFLLANLIPLVIMFFMASYLIYKEDGNDIMVLPCAALLIQTFSFAVALVARINLLKDELKQRQLEAQNLQQENDKMLARNRYIELENEYIIAEIAHITNKITHEVNQKQELQQKLEANHRELTANTLYLYQKNEMLSSLQKQIENLSYKDTTPQNRDGIREIKSTMQNDAYLENDWDKFKLHFEEVHPDFFKDLKENYPTLTPNEIRLSAYYHLNISVKEIAMLLNINPRSVHKAKSRLNKKMGQVEVESKE